jgi:hypothetical protein
MTRRRLAPLVLLPALVLAAALGASTPALSSPSQEGSPAPKTRVGTFRRTDVLVAWHRSERFHAALGDLVRRRDEAQAKGDSSLVRSLEERGAAMQDRSHRQLAGQETIPEILEALAPSLAEVARETNVSAVAETLDYHDPATIEIVDVTDALVRRLPAAVRSAKK